MKPRRVLVYPDNMMAASEFAFILRRCKFEATVIVSSYKIEEFFQGIRNIEVVRLYKGRSTKVSDPIVPEKVKKSSKSSKRIPAIIKAPLLALSFYKKYRLFKTLLTQKYSTAIISSDRSYGDGFIMPFFRFCKQNNIEMFIPSVANFADKERMLKVREKDIKRFQPTILEKCFFPSYITSLNGQKLCYYPFDILLTFKLFGVLPKNPWVMGSNNSSVVTVNSQFEREKLIESGVAEQNVKVTGSLKIFDDFVSGSSSVETIGIALPQMFEHNLLPWEEHITVIEGLLSGASCLDKDVVVFLHPKMNRQKYKYLESKYRCSISEQKTDEGIKGVDVYVATFSSTVLTATIFGVPSLVIDCFDAKYTMFDHLPSVQIFDSVQELIDKLAKTVGDDKAYKLLKKQTLVDSKVLEENQGHGMTNFKKLIQNEI